MKGYKSIIIHNDGRGASGYMIPLKQTLRKEKIKNLFQIKNPSK